MSSIFYFFQLRLLLLAAGFFFMADHNGSRPSSSYVSGGIPVMASLNPDITYRVHSAYFGFNAQMMRGPEWQASGFVDRVRGLHPGVIRYPGGTVASYWDWKTGTLMKGIALRNEWKNIKSINPIRLEDLKFACDKTGSAPLFVLNMMNSTIEYQMEMLRHAKSIGLPVLYAELDNEIYLGDEFYVNKYPDGSMYARDANKWIAAIKKEFPGVKVAVVGNSYKEGAARKHKPNALRAQNWNRDVLSQINNADAITFHVYGGAGMNFFGDPFDDGDDAASEIQAKFDKPDAIRYVLSGPFRRWKNTSTYDYKILPSGMQVWITEFNLFEREGVVAGTWAHGLYALMQTLLFMENQRTEMVCYHNLTTSAQFAAIFNSDTGFFKAVRPKPTQRFGYTASGYCFNLVASMLKQNGIAIKVAFNDNKTLSASRGFMYPALYGWKISGDKKTGVVLVNLSAEKYDADISGLIKGGAVYEQLWANPHMQVAGEKDISRGEGEGKIISLMPYSVTVINGS